MVHVAVILQPGTGYRVPVGTFDRELRHPPVLAFARTLNMDHLGAHLCCHPGSHRLGHDAAGGQYAHALQRTKVF